MKATRKAAIGMATAVVGLVATGGAAVGDPQSATRSGGSDDEVLFHENFRSGFDSDDKWLLGSAQTADGTELPQGDGVITTGKRGMTVVPTGTNPATGRPAFAATAAQDAEGFGGGTGDHLKWVAQPRVSSENGVAVPKKGALACTSKMAVDADYVDEHPFGDDAVSDPQSDPRLASSTLISVDHTTHTVANLTSTNGEIHAVYERLPVEDSTYASYHFSVPVAKRTPGKTDTLQIKFDRGGKRVSWYVNGKNVLSTDQIGTHAFDKKDLRLEHGGKQERVSATSVQCGVGTGNLLDGAGGEHDKDKRGLVRLSKDENFYYAPGSDPAVEQTFLDDDSKVSNRLWGQGVKLNVRAFDMRYER